MPAALRTRLRAARRSRGDTPPEATRRRRRRDVDAGVVLRETGHFTSGIDRNRELADPLGQDALDMVLPQPEKRNCAGWGASLMSRGMWKCTS